MRFIIMKSSISYMNQSIWLLISVCAHLLIVGIVMAVAVSDPQASFNQAPSSISVTLISSASDSAIDSTELFASSTVERQEEISELDVPKDMKVSDEERMLELAQPSFPLPAASLPHVPPVALNREKNRKATPPKPSFSAASTASNGSMLNTPASPYRNPTPPYPQAARHAGFEGKALMHVEICSDGRVEDCRILQSSGRRDCDESALRTITGHWRFRPAERMGKPVASSEKILVRFVLTN
jgi:periplasmic protein TonB